jgi:RHS repeat-associated protein
LWDNLNCLQELDGGLALIAHYSDYPGVWGGLASQRRGASSSFYGFDMQWTTRLLASILGAVADTYVCDAFGVEVTSSGATVNVYRYVGQWGYRADTHSRLEVKMRQIRVSCGGWLSRDSLRDLHEGLAILLNNGYVYVSNSPIRWLDPMGLAPLQAAKWPTVIGTVPSDVVDIEVCTNFQTGMSTGRDGGTGCNQETGKAYSVICDTTCNKTCTEQHEKVHRVQRDPCCQRYALCLKPNSGVNPADCGEQWKYYATANAPSWECAAYAVTVKCSGDLLKKGTCCTKQQVQIYEDRYKKCCDLAKGAWKSKPCPFDKAGKITNRLSKPPVQKDC